MPNGGDVARHGIVPSEAEEVIRNDPYDVSAEVVNGEERFVSLGHTDAGRFLVVVTAMRATAIRVVTAFPANRRLVDVFVSQRRS